MTPSPRGEYEQKLIDAARERRARLMAPVKPKAPKPAPLPMVRAVPPLPPAGNRLGVYSVHEEADDLVVPADRALTPRTAQKAMAEACEGTGVSLIEAMGRIRSRHIVAVRHACWAKLHQRGYSMATIARAYGVDHTTVIFAIRKFNARHEPMEQAA